MDQLNLSRSIAKLATAGERAGLTVEQMIQLLQDGLGVDDLVSMIEWKLAYVGQKTPTSSPHLWVC
jgi:hypothetical protein